MHWKCSLHEILCTKGYSGFAHDLKRRKQPNCPSVDEQWHSKILCHI